MCHNSHTLREAAKELPMRNQTVVASYPGYTIVKPRICGLTNLPVFKNDDTVALKRTRSYKIFTFGSVASFALESGDCPFNSYKMAVERGHKLHWLNANAVVISNMKSATPVHYEIKIGDKILFEGVIFMVEKDWNDNLKLVEVGSKQEILDEIYKGVSAG
jgi:hypothetical protein